MVSKLSRSILKEFEKMLVESIKLLKIDFKCEIKNDLTNTSQTVFESNFK
jgi:hypothetical protein